MRMDWNLLLRELKAIPLGTREIVSEIFSANGYRMVTTECRACGEQHNVSVDAIRKGNSRNCKCQRNRKYHDKRAFVLQERYSALQQRCENPKSQSWLRYGGRGIQNNFNSVQQFVHYMLRYHPHPSYRGVEIDRSNNNGHYEPGNIRLVSHETNQRNKRSNKVVLYRGARMIATDAARALKLDYPSCTVDVLKVASYLRQGVHWKKLILLKGRGPYKKRAQSSVRYGKRGGLK